MCNKISVALKEAKRCESVKDRRDAFTRTIQQALRTDSQGQAPYSLKSAQIDWLNAGILAGYKKIE